MMAFVGYIKRNSSLNGLKLVDVMLRVWVSKGCPVSKQWQDEGLV